MPRRLLVIATTLRETGITGVHTYFRQLKRYLDANGAPPALITPFSWGRPLIAPVFGVRFLLQPVSGAANYWWYRYWHEAFLRRALARTLAGLDQCVVYAQCPRRPVPPSVLDAARTNASSWRCTSASLNPTNGSTRVSSVGTAGCSAP